MDVSNTKHLFPTLLPLALVLASWLSLLCICPMQVTAATQKSKELMELDKASVVLGKKSWKDWKAETDWDSYAAEDYKPNKGKVSTIARLAKAQKATFLLFAGSWCKDSEAQLPVIMKLLGAAQIPARSIELYGVDANLKEPSGKAQQLDVINSPTLIILKGQIELGRIVVRPATTWEGEIHDILSK